MQRLRIVPALGERLGDQGSEALTEMVLTAGKERRDNVLESLTNRFERRLTEEISTLRVEVTKELARMRVEIIRWSFLFWITQFGGMAAMLAYMK